MERASSSRDSGYEEGLEQVLEGMVALTGGDKVEVEAEEEPIPDPTTFVEEWPAPSQKFRPGRLVYFSTVESVARLASLAVSSCAAVVERLTYQPISLASPYPPIHNPSQGPAMSPRVGHHDAHPDGATHFPRFGSSSGDEDHYSQAPSGGNEKFMSGASGARATKVDGHQRSSSYGYLDSASGKY
ncbi:hypothetical protein NM208_g5282 [Fusarium decemcellulare]|uniref:Uncharacterized protein n=1 Tax=Fusarium decemcellulare TaxID=57161 RepID=A0ACC1SHI6_9HYPO|nr:hypothetical protein NM208_g5282 [Fusarium decemcellulare]